MSHRFVPSMSSTAISIAVRDEIQRFESVHPNIYAIHDAIEDIENARIQQQIRQCILAIEDAFVNSQEWTLSRPVIDLKLGIVGTFNSGKASMVHRYLTGSYIYEDSFEGGRFKKEVTVEGQSYLLLIREEGGPPDMQFSQWVDAVVFVFSVDSETSFNSLYSYFAKMSLHRNMSEVPIILVATQDSITDSNPRHIDDVRARKMAADFKNSIYIEVCSSYGLNVDRVFNEACQRMLNMRLASSRAFGPVASTLARAYNRSHSNPKYSDHSSTNSSINSIYQPSSLSLQNGLSNGDQPNTKTAKKYTSDSEKITYHNSVDDFSQIDPSTDNLKNNNSKATTQKPIKKKKVPTATLR